MKISVITPTYNRRDFLMEAVKSVCATILIPLTDLEWEYIIYDDGSTDGTSEMFKTFPHPKVRYIRNEKNQGQAKARNDAVMEATGDYLFFLDSDDIILSRTLYNFAVKAKEFPDAGWLLADFLHVDDSLKYLVGEDYFAWKFENPKAMLEAIFKGEHFIQHCFMMKKSVFMEVGMYDPAIKMGEDIDLCIRALFKGYMPERCDFISHLHRFHDSNITKDMTHKKHIEDMEKFRVKYLGK